jgi:hypothetical protein
MQNGSGRFEGEALARLLPYSNAVARAFIFTHRLHSRFEPRSSVSIASTEGFSSAAEDGLS